MTFRAGAAEVVITPPIGTLLEGYGGRDGGAIGVHDDLHARAVVFDDGSTRAAVVACDLVAIDRHLSGTVRRIAEEAAGVPAANVMVAATHTHAGPAGLHPDADGALFDVTARLIAGAIVDAAGRLRPAVLKAGNGRVDTVSQNRREPRGPIDDQLHVLLFDTPSPFEPPIASIVNFACHATVLYRTNMHVSADYPGHVVRTVKGILGPSPVLFLNGACGDVNPSWIEQNHDEAERVGSIIGAEAARRLQELRPLGHAHRTWNIRWDELTPRETAGELIDEPRVRVKSTHVAVSSRAMAPQSAYAERLAAAVRERDDLLSPDVEGRRRVMERITMLQGDRTVAARPAAGSPRVLHPEVQVLGFGGGVAIAGLPGECFAETARAIRVESAVPRLMISCYTNHHVYYIVPKGAFAEGGYEPGVSVLDDEAEEAMRMATIALLKDVRDG